MADLNLLTEDSLKIISIVGRYPSILLHSLAQIEPSVIVTYLFQLSHAVSSSLEKMRVVGVENNLAEARLLVYWSARIVIGNALRLLGLIPLERM